MKTIYTLSTIVLIALSLNSLADDKLKNRDKSNAVSVAPFVWGDPEEAAPAELVEGKKAVVPVAPFVWGSPEDAVSMTENQFSVVHFQFSPFLFQLFTGLPSIQPATAPAGAIINAQQTASTKVS